MQLSTSFSGTTICAAGWVPDRYLDGAHFLYLATRAVASCLRQREIRKFEPSRALARLTCTDQVRFVKRPTK